MKFAKVLFAGTSLILTFQPALRAEWFLETVDDSEPAGFACSMVLDASGTPHISYWRSSPAPFPQFLDLYYARKTGAAWLTEEALGVDTMSIGQNTSIAIGPGGQPAIAFQSNGTFLRFLQRDPSGVWPGSPSEVVTGNGNFLSLIFDDINESTPTPKIAGSQGTSLNFFTPSGMTWSNSTTDSTNAGDSCSMAIAPNGEIGIAYLKSGTLRFANSILGGPPAPLNALVFKQTFTATRCALAFDANSSAHIFYYDETNNRYCHLTNANENGVWDVTPEVVTAAGTRAIDAFGCSIAAGSDGSLHVAFIDYETNSLRYGKKAGGVWTFETVDAQGSTGGSCQIRLDSQNRPKIAFHDITDATLRFAQRFAALSLIVDGRKKRTTAKRALRFKGSASDSAVAVEWRIGKKAFQSSALPATGKWSVTARGLKRGKNKVQFRAKGVTGSVTAVQTFRVIRD